MQEIKYSPFEKYVIRVPILPMGTVSRLRKEDIKELFNIPYIREALYSASPEFYQEALKWITGKVSKNEDKIVFTLLKYLIRMGTRSTPFGFFSSSAIGAIGDATSIKIKDTKNFKAFTRLDMDFLCALSQSLENNNAVRLNLKFFPNNTLYKVGEELRYIEYRYYGTVRRHFTSSIDSSDFISSLLEKARKGLTFKDLIKEILEPEISEKDAANFIHELIDNQILVSSISPALTSYDLLNSLMDELKSTSNVGDMLTKLKRVLDEINDKPLGLKFISYASLYRVVDQMSITYSKKYLLQTDLVGLYDENKISRSLFKKIEKSVWCLNKLSSYKEPSELKEFREKFYNRFEDEEVPLALALDIESGIGFGSVSHAYADISPLIDDLDWSTKLIKSDMGKEIVWTKKDTLLHNKVIESIRENKQIIEINDDDLRGFSDDWHILPDTFSVFLNLFRVDNEEIALNITHAGGENAATVMGRFCQSDDDMKNYVNEIVKKEQYLNDAIVAEVVHLPEKRVGNILQRPNLREYEIPYLAKSSLSKNHQITIDDITVSIKNDRIILKSKKLKREIKPKLTTAHDYTRNALPVYHFLCLMQLHQRKGSLTFSWGNLYRLFKFLPRVTYDGVILSRAEWVITETDIKKLSSNKNIESFRRELKLPSVFLLAEGDNELLIDSTNALSVKMFIHSIKNQKMLILKEHLFRSEKSPVIDGNKNFFSNELIVSFYKNVSSNGN